MAFIETPRHGVSFLVGACTELLIMLIVLTNQALVLEPRAVESWKTKHSLTGGSANALCMDGEVCLREADTVGEVLGASKPPAPWPCCWPCWSPCGALGV